MISLKYNVNTTPVIAETYLNPCTSNEAFFYLDKKDDFNKLVIRYKHDIGSPTIYKTSFSGKKHKVYTNTTRIIASNINTTKGVMYYKLVSLFDEPFTVEDVILNSTIDCIEHDGIIYTNDKVDNVQIRENVYLFSVPAIELNKKVSYTSKHIVVEFEYDKDDLVFKCEEVHLASYTLINNNKVHIDSFYAQKEGKQIYQCIEGDVINVDKEEIVLHSGNSIDLKDKIHSIEDGFVSYRTNKLYTINTYAEAESTINYVATRSSHVFFLDGDVTYFKITDIGLEKGTEKEHDFSLTLEPDHTKINIITSTYLYEQKYDIIHKDYVIIEKDLVDRFRQVALKQYIKSYLTIPPSEVVYIQHDDKKVYQHTNNTDIESIPVEEDTFSMENYSFSTTSYLDNKNIKIINNISYYL